MYEERLRVGRPPLGPPPTMKLDPAGDLSDTSYAHIEGWEPGTMRGAKLARYGDGVRGDRILRALQTILSSEISWVDLHGACVRHLVASNAMLSPRRAMISPAEACKVFACFPATGMGAHAVYRCDELIWGLGADGSRKRYEALRAEIEKPGSAEPDYWYPSLWAMWHAPPPPEPTQAALF